MNSETIHTDVLIVGAGPTGLMMACQLARHNISFRIIEKNSGPTTQSRALAIHAGSMEIFAQMGIADRFVAQGKITKAINYLVKGKVAKHIPLSEFGKGLTEFPFLLILEQSKTERLLVDFLSEYDRHVQWQSELITFSQTEEIICATVKGVTGEEEIINTKWLIAADGAKSTVREMLKIPFGGQTYPLDLFVLDCKVNWPLKEDEMYIAFSDYSFAGFFPMPEGRCRVIGFVPDSVQSKNQITFDDVQKGFAARMQMPVELTDPKWISVYHAHHRYVSSFFVGKCFLTGDAAHIHSPVGAQGMNTGLQDAFNLAWKLAFVLKGLAKPELLSTYQKERLPFAKQLVQTTDRAFGITVNQNLIIKWMRMYVMPRLLGLMLKVKFIEGLIFKTVSQIGIKYIESPLSRDASLGNFPAKAPRPGERFPFLEYKNGKGKSVNIQKEVSGLTLHLFVFADAGENLEMLNKITSQYKIYVTLIPAGTNTETLYKTLGIAAAGCYLVRPDLYIAYRQIGLHTQSLEKYLVKFLIS